MLDGVLKALPHLLGTLVAVLVAVSAQYHMARRDRKRQARRAFAETVIQCCEEMESAALSYWTDDAPGTEALVGKMHAALRKMIRTIATSSCLGDDERKNLTNHWKFIQRALRRGFDIEDRKTDAGMAMFLIGVIIDARCAAAEIRA